MNSQTEHAGADAPTVPRRERRRIGGIAPGVVPGIAPAHGSVELGVHVVGRVSGVPDGSVPSGPTTELSQGFAEVTASGVAPIACAALETVEPSLGVNVCG